MKTVRIGFVLCALLLVSACSELELGSHFAKTWGERTPTQTGDFKVGNPYKIKGRTYVPQEKYAHSETGIASWYGPGFHGKMTANGEIFNRNDLTAAHRTLQMPSIVRVTNLNNGRSLIVRVNDRGPFAHDRVIDLSEKAAEVLGFKRQGTTRVRIDVMEEESRIVASAAKRGVSTRGTEIALNRRQSLDDLKVASPMPQSKPAVDVARPSYQVASALPVQSPEIRYETLPPVVKPQQASAFESRVLHNVGTKPVRNQNIVTSASVQPRPVYIQAGAFSSEDNAMTLKNALYTVSEPVHVYRNVEGSGNIMYRVKIGPVETVEKADEILNMLNRQGRSATIVASN